MSRQLLKPALLGLAACGMLLVADPAQAGRHRRYHGGYYGYGNTGYGYDNGCNPCGQPASPCSPCGQAVSPCSPCGAAGFDQGMQNPQGQMNPGSQPYSSARPIYRNDPNATYSNGATYQENQVVPMNQPNAPAPVPPQRTFQNAPANQGTPQIQTQGSVRGQVNPNTNQLRQNVEDNAENALQNSVPDNVPANPAPIPQQ
jgi:hypothetical protein